MSKFGCLAHAIPYHLKQSAFANRTVVNFVVFLLCRRCHPRSLAVLGAVPGASPQIPAFHPQMIPQLDFHLQQQAQERIASERLEFAIPGFCSLFLIATRAVLPSPERCPCALSHTSSQGQNGTWPFCSQIVKNLAIFRSGLTTNSLLAFCWVVLIFWPNLHAVPHSGIETLKCLHVQCHKHVFLPESWNCSWSLTFQFPRIEIVKRTHNYHCYVNNRSNF